MLDSLNIVLLTLGTRGDVQPFLALGRGLKQAGYSVTLGTSRDFAQDAANHDLSFAPFSFSVREALADPDCRGAFVSKRAALRLYRKVAPLMPQLLDDAWDAAKNAQLLVFHPKILNALDIAEKLRIPAVAAFYLPALSPTCAFPAPFFPGPRTWGGFLNKVSHKAFLYLMTAPYRRLCNHWRARVLGLPPRPPEQKGAKPYSSLTKLYCYSSHLVPRPADWDSSNLVTGHWFLDTPADYQPPAELVQFLRHGSPPVLISFGSIAGVSPGAATALVLAALNIAATRAVIATGWGGLPPAAVRAEQTFFVDSVPYDWLAPQVAALVHHGGAGSTAEGLRAGKPAVICPFFGDQHFWGRRVQDLAVGPVPIPQKHLTAQNLAAAILSAINEDNFRRRAGALGEKIRAEAGVQTAISALQVLLGH